MDQKRMLARRRSAAALSVSIALLFVLAPTVALAQAASPSPSTGSLPQVTTAVAVVTILSLLVGALTSMQQTGKLLGQYQLPPWAVTLVAIVLPFFAGAYSVLKGATTIDASAVFWAAASGIGQMIASSASGAAVAAHHVVPAMLRSLPKAPSPSSTKADS